MEGIPGDIEDSVVKQATKFATKADEINNNNKEFNEHFETLYKSLTGFKDNTVVLKDKLIYAVEQFGNSLTDLKDVFIAYFDKLNKTIETFKDPKEFMNDMTSRIKTELSNEAGKAGVNFIKENGASLLTGVVKASLNPSTAALAAVSAAASAGPKALAKAPKQIIEKSPIMMEKILREKFVIIIDLIEFIQLFQDGVKEKLEKPGEETSLSPEDIKAKMAELLGKHTANSDSDSDISSKTDQITKLLFEMDVEKMKDNLNDIRVQFLKANGFSTKESPVEQMKSLFKQLKIDMENLATKLKTGQESVGGNRTSPRNGGTRRNKTNQQKRKSSKRKIRK
jgi:lipoate-protein ligase A